MKININLLSATNIRQAAQAVQLRANEIQSKTTQLLDRMALQAESQASTAYAGSVYEDMVAPSVSHVTSVNTATVTASGSDTLFIEFGTGIHDATHPDPLGSKYYPTSYSASHAQNLTKENHEDYWWYNHEQHYGEAAHPCLYEAKEDLKRTYKGIAREVFKW